MKSPKNFNRTLCNVPDCENKSEFQLKLCLRAHPNHEPAFANLPMFVCGEHIDYWKWDDIVTPENWRNICEGVESIGRQRPVEKYCYIEPVRL